MLDERLETFADRLSYALEKTGVTKAELGRRAGLGKSLIGSYCVGRCIPRMDRAVKIADALGVDDAWLLGIDNAEYQRAEDALSKVLLVDEDQKVLVYKNQPYVALAEINEMILALDEKEFSQWQDIVRTYMTFEKTSHALMQQREG